MTQFYGTLTPEKTEREEKNMQLVRKGAGECMVLLENDGVLPLKKIGKIFFSDMRHISYITACCRNSRGGLKIGLGKLCIGNRLQFFHLVFQEKRPCRCWRKSMENTRKNCWLFTKKRIRENLRWISCRWIPFSACLP